MENKGKTTPNQPPIPRPVGFLYLYFPFVSSWLQVNYATTEGSPERSRRKQTQFPQGQNQRNLLCHTELPQYSTPPNPKKQSQNKPNPSQKLELSSTLSKVEGPNKPILPPDSPMSFYNTTISASSAVKNTPRIIHPLPIAPESAIIQPLKNPNLHRKHIWLTTSHNKSNC